MAFYRELHGIRSCGLSGIKMGQTLHTHPRWLVPFNMMMVESQALATLRATTYSLQCAAGVRLDSECKMMHNRADLRCRQSKFVL